MGRLDSELWRFKLRRSLIRHLPLYVCMYHQNPDEIGFLFIVDSFFNNNWGEGSAHDWGEGSGTPKDV